MRLSLGPGVKPLIAVLLSLLLAPKPDNLWLSTSIYAFTATADEMTSVDRQEAGLIKSQAERIGLKVLILPAYLAITYQASKSPHKWVRVMGQVGRWGVPAMFLGAAVHSLTVPAQSK